METTIAECGCWAIFNFRLIRIPAFEWIVIFPSLYVEAFVRSVRILVARSGQLFAVKRTFPARRFRKLRSRLDNNSCR